MNGSSNASEPPVPSQVDPLVSQRNGLTPTQRWLSLAELVVGGAIVFGHNVYHLLPNEVPILFVLGLISVRLRDGGWTAMGLATSPILGANGFVRARSRSRKNPARRTRGGSTYRPLLAPRGCTEWHGPNYRPCDGGTQMAWDRVDFCRLRGRDRVPGLPGHARGRSGRAVEGCILGRRAGRGSTFRIWTLLQRPFGHGGFGNGWPGSWRQLRSIRAQFVGLHPGARIY